MHLFFIRKYVIPLLVVAVCGLAGQPADALPCSAVITYKTWSQAYAESRSLGQAEREYLAGATWLAKNGLKIDPRTDHIPSLVPIVERIINNVAINLPEKLGQPAYFDNEHWLRLLFAEARKRIHDQTITYEYAAALPLRLGFLLEMSGEDSSLNVKFDPPEAFLPATYADHGAFMAVVRKASLFKSNSERQPVFRRFWQTFESFPLAPLMPVYGILSYRCLNLINSLDVWPVAVVTKTLTVDGRPLNEFLIPMHDIAHRLANLGLRVFFGFSLMPADPHMIAHPVLQAINRKMVNQIEFLNVDANDLQILHFVHSMVMHEPAGDEFVYHDAFGIATEAANRQTTSKGLHLLVERVLDHLATPAGHDLESFKLKDFDQILAGTETRQQAMQRIRPIYLGILDLALARQSSFGP